MSDLAEIQAEVRSMQQQLDDLADPLLSLSDVVGQMSGNQLLTGDHIIEIATRVSAYIRQTDALDARRDAVVDRLLTDVAVLRLWAIQQGATPEGLETIRLQLQCERDQAEARRVAEDPDLAGD